jgi:hypothetical protein
MQLRHGKVSQGRARWKARRTRERLTRQKEGQVDQGEVKESGKSHGLIGVAMDMATDAPLLMADAAIELFLAVHPDDYPGVLETGLVPRRT